MLTIMKSFLSSICTWKRVLRPRYLLLDHVYAPKPGGSR